MKRTQVKDYKEINKVKDFKEIDEKIQPFLSEITLDVESAIECIETKIRCGLGKETIRMLPIDGIAVKVLLDEYKKLKNLR